MSRKILEPLELEYRRYRELGERALEQVPEELLCQQGPAAGNSLGVIVQHLSGNFKSRFTDFFTTDGEKPWRNRDGEFVERKLSRGQINQLWKEGWEVLEKMLQQLSDEDLQRKVALRGKELTIIEALVRNLAHVSYHVGQMLFLSRILCGPEWKYLTIPPGQSQQYNQNPTLERGHTGSDASSEGRE